MLFYLQLPVIGLVFKFQQKNRRLAGTNDDLFLQKELLNEKIIMFINVIN